MATRSTTTVYSAKGGDPLVVMYRHSDGYPEGHGVQLAEWLDEQSILTGPEDSDGYNNGIGELAAKLVAHFKKKFPRGNIYLDGPQVLGIDYAYSVYPSKGRAFMSVDGFDDDPREFSTWLQREAE